MILSTIKNNIPNPGCFRILFPIISADNYPHSQSSRPNSYQNPIDFQQHQDMDVPNSPSMHSRNTPSHYDSDDDFYSPSYSPDPYSSPPYAPQRPEFEPQNSTEDAEGYQGWTLLIIPNLTTKKCINVNLE